MILDLQTFVTRERPYWTELATMVARLQAARWDTLDLASATRLHYLYERAAAALVQIQTFSGEMELRKYVESLVASAYAIIHAGGRPRRKLALLHWFFVTFPVTFRRHVRAFALSVAITLAGVALGAAAIAVDPDSKPVLLPFEHLQGNPSDRVREEEQTGGSRHGGEHAPFASFLMTHNIQVSLLVMALGFTFGLGTITLLFYNGVILGAVAADYIRAGESVFLAGWLLPHGSIEIPAILLAGQAGLVLASALIGRGEAAPLKLRLRAQAGDLVTLVMGVAVMLVWAGLVESFLSQYHEPVLPYAIKIALGCIELALLAAFLAFSGRGARNDPSA